MQSLIDIFVRCTLKIKTGSSTINGRNSLNNIPVRSHLFFQVVNRTDVDQPAYTSLSNASTYFLVIFHSSGRKLNYSCASRSVIRPRKLNRTFSMNYLQKLCSGSDWHSLKQGARFLTRRQSHRLNPINNN